MDTVVCYPTKEKWVPDVYIVIKDKDKDLDELQRTL